MLNLDAGKFYMILAGASLVILGIWMKNGLSKQATGKVPIPNVKHVGMGAFILGWLTVAYAVSSDKNLNLMNGLKTPKGITGLLSSVLIVGSVLMIMKGKESGQKDSMVWGIGFLVGWLALGLSSGMGGRNLSISAILKNRKTWFGLAASALVLFAMTRMLPWERKQGITDSLGMAMFTGGWGSLAVAQSLVY